MRPKDYVIAKELKGRLTNVVPLIDFRVFGSRARGDSDITWEVGFENFVVISILIFTRDEIESSPLRSSPIVRNIMEEGVTV